MLTQNYTNVKVFYKGCSKSVKWVSVRMFPQKVTTYVDSKSSFGTDLCGIVVKMWSGRKHYKHTPLVWKEEN